MKAFIVVIQMDPELNSVPESSAKKGTQIWATIGQGDRLAIDQTPLH